MFEEAIDDEARAALGAEFRLLGSLQDTPNVLRYMYKEDSAIRITVSWLIEDPEAPRRLRLFVSRHYANPKANESITQVGIGCYIDAMSSLVTAGINLALGRCSGNLLQREFEQDELHILMQLCNLLYSAGAEEPARIHGNSILVDGVAVSISRNGLSSDGYSVLFVRKISEAKTASVKFDSTVSNISSDVYRAFIFTRHPFDDMPIGTEVRLDAIASQT